MPFGDFIRKMREEKQIQMNDFARQLEISPAYWSRIERNIVRADSNLTHRADSNLTRDREPVIG